jgi:quercetin dioxygenase-like cupin family protein
VSPTRATRIRTSTGAAALVLAVLLGVSGCAAGGSSTSESSASTGPSASAGATTAAPTGSAAPASATASPTASTTPSPIVVEELGKGAQDAAVDVEVAGPAQVAFRRITIAPGAGTGLHCHDGQLVAVVEAGTLTHYAPIYPGGVHEYVTGDSIVEGAHYVHEGRNEGTDDVVLLVSYVIEAGEPLAETDLSKCDPQE